MDAAETAWWAVLERETLASLSRRLDGILDVELRRRSTEWLARKVNTP